MHDRDVSGLLEIGSSRLAGSGDGMQVMTHGDVLYVGHLGTSGMGTSILDAADPTDLRLVRQWPAPRGGHTHKVQVADGLLLTNHEAFRGSRPERVGLAVYDLTDPFDPREIGFWDSTGDGVHRIVWEGGRYAYMSATPDGFKERIWVVIDLEDPSRPVERARWWWPGMSDGESPDWPESEKRSVHHAMVDGDRAYLGLWDSGMVVLDIADLDRIDVISRLNWEIGGNTHTCLPLPGRNLVVVTDEAILDDCQGQPHMVRVVDVSDESAPFVASICPMPEGDFCERGLRFGAHCLHENRPGSYQSERFVFVTWLNAGLRVYDLADAAAPKEVAHWIPACPPGQKAVQINDVLVTDDLTIYATDRVTGGLFALEPEDWLSEALTNNKTSNPASRSEEEEIAG